MENFKQYLDEGIYNFQDGFFEKAIENLDKAIALNNTSNIAYFYRGAVYHSMEEYDNALLDYTKAILLDDKMVDAYYNRAKIILSRKDIENPDIKKAISDLEKAIELNEKFEDALYAVSAAYKRIGDYHKSLEYLEKLLQLYPDNVFAKALKKLILQKYIV